MLRLILKLYGIKKFIVVQLSENPRSGTLIVKVDVVEAWKKEKFLIKFKSLFFLGYKPSSHIVSKLLINNLNEDYFGNYWDFSEAIREVILWHYSLPNNIENLNDSDQECTHGIESSGVITRFRLFPYRKTGEFNLSLFSKYPHICLLISPMVAKFPVRSIKNHLDLDFYFAFNEIRKAKHPCADELIRLTYDLFLIQHKITLGRIDLSELIEKSDKSTSDLSIYSVDAVRIFDGLIAYLKATIEKATCLLGLIYEIKDLDSKGKHQARMNSLNKKIPQIVKDQYYWDFIMDQLDYKKLEPLNNFRTGILHKKGISKTQPHNLIKDKENNNLKEFYQFVTTQHTNNTAMLICVFAIFTDKLVEIQKPDFSFNDIPIIELLQYIEKIKPRDNNI